MRSKILTIKTGWFAGLIQRSILVALLLVFAACETGPPVQEMSDARQAIAVARQAGAGELAADDLRQAEAYLDNAEKMLAKRSYSQARSDAMHAKEKALTALALAERTDEQK